MSKFFSPEPVSGDVSDGRRHAPATARNRDAILAVLQGRIPPEPSILEIASGSGEHAAYLAARLNVKAWQPTDVEPDNLISIDGWRTHADYPYLLPAQKFDAVTDEISHLGLATIDMVMAANLIHIAPFGVAKALIKKSADALKTGGQLFLYGPYKRDGKHTSTSNAEFDQSLKSRNQDWGIRDLEDIANISSDCGFSAPEVIQMPANNLSLFFRKN